MAGDLVYFVIPASTRGAGARAGRRGEEPKEIESGRMALCRDDQGTEFGLWIPQKSPKGGG